MTHQVAGPFCSMVLADLGAEVIKIERPPFGDTARNWPYFGPSVFLALNRNKKSIALDLGKLSGRDAFRRLVRKADVFLENLAPGVADKLGADYDSVKKINRKIIYCSISGYGKNNPRSKLPAWDAVIQAISGLMSVTGERRGGPVRIGASVVDMGAGLYAALAIVSCVLSQNARRKSGTFLDISLLDCATVWMTYWASHYSLYRRLPERSGSAWPAFVPYQVFRAKAGYVFIGATNDDYWKDLCRVLNLNSSLRKKEFSSNELRIKNSEELLKVLQNAIARVDRDDLIKKLRRAGVPSSPVNSVADLIRDPILKGRSMFKKMAYLRNKSFISAANPLEPSGIGVRINKPPPELGKDTMNVLVLLGYSKDQAKRIIEEHPITQRKLGNTFSQ